MANWFDNSLVWRLQVQPLCARRARSFVAAVTLVLAALACNGDYVPPVPHPTPAADAATADPTVAPDAGTPPEAPPTTPPASIGQARFCERAGDDEVRDVFCTDGLIPEIRGMRDLQHLLDVEPPPDAPGEPGGQVIPPEASNFVPFVVALGHSTSLSGRLISPINPRLLLLGGGTILAYQRGVQQVEIASRERAGGGVFNFYLLSFTQACNRETGGCKPGDLYTPKVESDWSALTIQDAEELKNTPEDCRQCHQRGLEKPTLLMRELESPWTHFFEPDALHDPQYELLPGVRGSDLVHDYLAAKGDEIYAGVRAESLRHTSGIVLQATMGAQSQPVLFDAPAIEYERYYREPEGWTEQENVSTTWLAAYERFKLGEQLALPYFDARPTDLDKQARLTEAYRRYREGEIDAAELPDLSDIFPDDPLVRAKIGLQTEPGATPAQALVQACGSCHNDVLDQSLSRARFSIDLARLEPAEIQIAIDRLLRPSDAPGVMPPPAARQLDSETRTQLLDYLSERMHSPEPDPLLERAATLGMASAAQRPASERMPTPAP